MAKCAGETFLLFVFYYTYECVVEYIKISPALGSTQLSQRGGKHTRKYSQLFALLNYVSAPDISGLWRKKCLWLAAEICRTLQVRHGSLDYPQLPSRKVLPHKWHNIYQKIMASKQPKTLDLSCFTTRTK